jgi:hypothetical protein
VTPTDRRAVLGCASAGPGQWGIAGSSPGRPLPLGACLSPKGQQTAGWASADEPARTARVRHAPTGVPAGSRPGAAQAEPPPSCGPTHHPTEASRARHTTSNKEHHR